VPQYLQDYHHGKNLQAEPIKMQKKNCYIAQDISFTGIGSDNGIENSNRMCKYNTCMHAKLIPLKCIPSMILYTYY
jgi:hypothetical protein